MDSPSAPKLVMIEDALWWNFERFCRIHGYVMTPVSGTEIVSVHRPGSAGAERVPRCPNCGSARIQVPTSDVVLCGDCGLEWDLRDDDRA